MQRLLSNLPKASASYNTFRTISTTFVLCKAAGRLRDEDIVKAFDKISVVDSITGKPQLGEDSRTVLRNIERSKYRLEVVSESGDIPLVKIIDKSEEYRKAKEKSNKDKEAKAAKSAKSKLEKEIQLTWMTSPHDLTHKLKKAHEVLSQKGKVSVVFANSSAHKRIPDVEKERIMNNVELQLGLGMNTNVARWKETEKTKRFWGFHLKGV